MGSLPVPQKGNPRVPLSASLLFCCIPFHCLIDGSGDEPVSGLSLLSGVSINLPTHSLGNANQYLIYLLCFVFPDGTIFCLSSRHNGHHLPLIRIIHASTKKVNIFIRLRIFLLTYEVVYATISSENKKTAAQRSGNSSAPAQVNQTPTQRTTSAPREYYTLFCPVRQEGDSYGRRGSSRTFRHRVG